MALQYNGQPVNGTDFYRKQNAAIGKLPGQQGFINGVSNAPPKPAAVPSPAANTYMQGAATKALNPTPKIGPQGQGATTNVNPSQPPSASQPALYRPPAETGVETTLPKSPQAGTNGSSLQDPGAITDAGKLYADRVTKNLQGNNPIVQNAQATEDTAAARRTYEARRATEDSLAQSPFAVGSAQYTRAMDQSQAGVNAANQQGQAGVNAVTRQSTADNMAAAKGLEDSRYGNAIGERSHNDLQTENLASSIKDPKAAYAFRAAVASGQDPKTAYDSIVGSTGSINTPYQSASPGATDVKGAQDSATAWITATQPNLKPGTPEFQKAVTDRMTAQDEAKNQPITSANDAADLQTAKKALSSGGTLTTKQIDALVASGDIAKMTSASGAARTLSGSDAATYLAKHPDGKVMLDGQLVHLDRGFTIGHLDVAEITGPTGQKYWMDQNGQWYGTQPKANSPSNNSGAKISPPFSAG